MELRDVQHTFLDAAGQPDRWLMHYQAEGGRENNAAEDYIANLSARNCQGHSLRLSSRADGGFAVTNERNGFTRTYKPRR